MTEHTSRGTTILIKAVRGNYSFSQDGVNYERVPTNLGRRLFGELQGDVSSLGDKLQGVRLIGTPTVNGTPVRRYTATLPASAVQGVIASLLQGAGSRLPKGFSFGTVVSVVDVDARTGDPVDMTETSRSTESLAAQHRPGVKGVLVIVETARHTFSDFHIHRSSTAGR